MTRTRVAPSPTGFPHIGTIYQAIFNRAMADQKKGIMVVRIEDTDQKRFVPGSEEIIFKSLEWAGIKIDEGPKQGGDFAPYRQSERLSIYKDHAAKLIELGGAYYCFCTEERLDQSRKEQEASHKPTSYDKHCRNLSPDLVKDQLGKKMSFVIRLKVPPDTTITVKDTIRGDISFQSNLIDDCVLLKSDGFPTYHLALVVDDHLMQITHPIRGEEWISSYPKHKLIYDFFGWPMPVYTHLPLLRNADGSKISKRQGHTSVDWYRQEGILPRALVNFLSLMVWNHPQSKEIYDFSEFVKYLDLKDVSINGPRFDLKKLEWMNGEYIRLMTDEDLADKTSKYLNEYSSNPVLKTLSPSDLLPSIPLIKERMKKLSEFEALAGFLFQNPADSPTRRVDGKNPSGFSSAGEGSRLTSVLEALPKPWTKEDWENGLRKLAQDSGVKPGEVFMDLRVAVTGSKVGPDLFDSIKILGEDEVLFRVSNVSS